MKKQILRLGGGLALAAVFMAVGTGSASASSGSDEHTYNDMHKSYGQMHMRYADYNKDNHDYSSKGMWYDGQWYSFKKMGYWDDCGHWVSYSKDWDKYDWKEWRSQQDDK